MYLVTTGMEVHGVPLVVISNGRVLKDEEGLHLTQGSGRFIPTPANASYVYGRVEARDRALAPQKVDREPYDGPVIELSQKVEEAKISESSPSKATDENIHHRPPTRSGGRNMQDSSFSLSG